MAKASAPKLGATTKRGPQLAQVLYLDQVVRSAAEDLYGPHNPLDVPDWTLALMAEDWTIGLCLEMWVTAYHGAEYWIEGPSSELNAFVQAVWQRRQRRWIRALLQAMVSGRVTAEIVWQLEDVAYQYVGPRGALRDAARRDAYVIHELRDLPPHEVTVLTDALGDYAGVRYRGKPLEPGRTIHVVNDQVGGSLRGRALHRRAYSPWWWGNLVYLGVNRYLERKGDPPLVGHAPSEEVVDEAGNKHDPVKTTSVLAANLRGGGNAVLPSDVDPESKLRSYDLREMQVAQRAEEFLSMAQHYEAQKAIGVLTMPDQVSTREGFAGKKVGRRAQSSMLADRQDSLILRPVNDWIIPKIVRANFGAVPGSEMPRACGGRLADNTIEIMAELVRSAQNVVGVTAKGRAVPVHSLFDWQKMARAIGAPLIDEQLIPEDLPAGGERPTAGQPAAIATNPSRPEGPGERGMSRAFAADGRTADVWMGGVSKALASADAAVSGARKAVEAARLKAERDIRGVLKRALEGAVLTEAADGREVASSRNRQLAARVRDEVEEILSRMDDGLLVESDIEAGAFADKLTPLGAAHVAAAQSARSAIEAGGLAAPSPSRTARAVRDVVRDGKTNGGGQVTREARRAQEIVDRLIQGGADARTMEQAVEAYELPARDLQASTTDHVRASARAVMSSSPVLEAGEELGGFAVLASEVERSALLERFPSGKAAELLFRVFDSPKALDDLYRSINEQNPANVTGWRNLGRTFGSPEYYVPFGASMAAGILLLMRELRTKWDEQRAARQRELNEQRAQNAGTESEQP